MMRLNQLFSIAFSIAFKNGANYLILREKKFSQKNNAIEQIALNRIFNRIYRFSTLLAVVVRMIQNPFRIRLFQTFLSYISAE